VWAARPVASKREPDSTLVGDSDRVAFVDAGVSPTTAASALIASASSTASIPAPPPVSSSLTNANCRVTGGVSSANVRIVSSIAATAPFMSVAPRP